VNFLKGSERMTGEAERIIGTGIDLVENARFRDVLSRWDDRFLSRVFLAHEQAYCRQKALPEQHFAGRFAIKEAVSKALMTGIGEHCGWLDIEVVRNAETGAPSVALHGKAAEYAQAIGVTRILISLSHTRDYAVASAVLVG
jgi:holo-[acyl-carrier protein] synthase